ncbi:MAG: TPM domain-containing protein [Tissierellia bacterium]|nr:TPM domain-containing protein [Tissierellia bacterium]
MNKKKNALIVISITILLILISVMPGYAGNLSESLPDPSYEGYVYDEVGLVTEDTKSHIINTAKELEQKTGAQVVVAIVNNLQDIPIEDYAVALFEKWKIGSKEEDNGILLLISKEDRKFRIEVGYGLEGPIPDSRAKELLNILGEFFKDGEFDQGIYEVYDRIVAYIAQEYDVELTGVPNAEEFSTSSSSGDGISLSQIIVFIIIIILISRYFGGGSGPKRRRRKYSSGTYGSGGWFIGGSSGGSSGGGYSGGGWSGGGGSSGGGGASGGW